MAMLRKLGQLANVFLEDQMKRQYAAYQSDLIKQRQEEVYRQGLSDKTMANLAPKLASGEISPDAIAGFDTMPPELQQVLKLHAATAPSAEQRGQTAIGDTLKNIGNSTDDEHLGSEDAALASGKSALQKARVPMGAGDDNPIWAVKDAFEAQQKQIGGNREAATARQKAQEQSNYDITHPGPETKEVGGFLFEKQPNGVWKKVAEGRAPEGRDTRPYYQLTPTYDAQGRPNGAIRLEGRTGDMVRVGDDQMGGQLRPPPGNLGEQTISNESALDALDNLQTQFDKGAKLLVGPVEGRLRVLGQNIPGVPVNDDFANFEAATAAFRNSVIKAITGAQMSEPEAARIRQQIPEVSDKAEVWQAKADQTKKNLAFLEARVRKDRTTTTAPPGVPTPVQQLTPAQARQKYGY